MDNSDKSYEIFIGKIKGNPNLMMTVICHENESDNLRFCNRIKSPLIMNLSFLHFWIVSKLENKNGKNNNIKKLINCYSHRVVSNNNERYVDWSLLEKVESDKIKQVLYIFIAFLAVEGQIEINTENNANNNNKIKFKMNKDKIEVQIPEIYFKKSSEKTNKYKEFLKVKLQKNYEDIKSELDPLIDFWS